MYTTDIESSKRCYTYERMVNGVNEVNKSCVNFGNRFKKTPFCPFSTKKVSKVIFSLV